MFMVDIRVKEVEPEVPRIVRHRNRHHAGLQHAQLPPPPPPQLLTQHQHRDLSPRINEAASFESMYVAVT